MKPTNKRVNFQYLVDILNLTSKTFLWFLHGHSHWLIYKLCAFMHFSVQTFTCANACQPWITSTHIYDINQWIYCNRVYDATNRTRKEKHERVCRKKEEMLARRVWTRESVAGLVFLDLSPCVLPRRCLSNVEEFLTGKKQKARSQKRRKKRLRGWEKKQRGKSKALVKQNHMGECGAGFDLGPAPDWCCAFHFLVKAVT